MAAYSQNKEHTVHSEPLLSNPTEDFLNKSFTKTQLQKHCRELGLTNVWVNKNALVEMLMEHASTHSHSKEETPHTRDSHTSDSSEQMDSDILNLINENEAKTREIIKLTEQILEINQLKERVSARVAALEEHTCDQTSPTHPPLTSPTPPPPTSPTPSPPTAPPPTSPTPSPPTSPNPPPPTSPTPTPSTSPTPPPPYNITAKIGNMDTQIKILEDNVESIKSNISSETTSQNLPNEICRIMEDRISALEETATETQNNTEKPSNNEAKLHLNFPTHDLPPTKTP
ncbi:hypothetical protein Pcinc_002677 [Petrolisthes cinctipes]|uniref:Uncharacterized protein n=1 Tax=Petrolisthes cinctipes TaxID=88211 RepID=A0AAE1GKH1_PETCI|nr:hypothetical protein Pcinc_002677 [Petrolisthes cinctipes]